MRSDRVTASATGLYLRLTGIHGRRAPTRRRSHGEMFTQQSGIHGYP
jgi:hypothetical protein